MNIVLLRKNVVIAVFVSLLSFNVVETSSAVELNLVGTFEKHEQDPNWYGRDVAVDGNIAVVGSSTIDYHTAPGSVYIYDFSDPENVIERKLVYSLANTHNSLGKFGENVAISGSYVFVGATNENNIGAVYMYNISDMDNIVCQKITAFDEGNTGCFGESLAVDGTRLLVGCPQYSAASTQPPAAYLIDFSDPDNIQQHKIVKDPNTRVGRFSEFLDISGDCAVISHWNEKIEEQGGAYEGAAYVYDLRDLDNMVPDRILAEEVANVDDFGRRVAISGNTFIASDGWSHVFMHDLSDLENITQTILAGGSLGWDVDVDGSLASVISGVTNQTYFYDLGDPSNPVLMDVISTPGAYSTAVDGNTVVVAGDGVLRVFQVVPEPSGIVLLLTLFGLLVGLRGVTDKRCKGK